MMLQDTIERETLIAAPVERVWDLVTQAEHLGRWFGDAGAEIDLRPGGALTMTWEQYGTAHGRVEHVEPPHRFAYRWLATQTPDGAEVNEGNSTLVEFTLTSQEGGTRLRVVESGFATLDRSDAERTVHYDSHAGGWPIELGHLVTHAQTVAV
jgi:uncharacterized protein YndB with AHSA1/START domain